NGRAFGLAQSVSAPRSMMFSSERASAATVPSSSRPMLAAKSALVIEPPNVGQDRHDLAFAEHVAKSGHGARLAFLDALDDVFVALLGLRQLRTPACGAAAVLVAKATRGGEHTLAIDV